MEAVFSSLTPGSDVIMVTFRGSSYNARGIFRYVENGIVCLDPEGDYFWLKFPVDAVATVALRDLNTKF